MKASSIEKFIPVLESVASLSKDRSTKVGAIAFGKAREIRAIGYNGMPRGCNDDEETRHERPEKYFWTEHAERNLIYNAARVGTPLKGCTMMVTHIPCMDCARAIVQSGFKKVIAIGEINRAEWEEHSTRARALFKECGVKFKLKSKLKSEIKLQKKDFDE